MLNARYAIDLFDCPLICYLLFSITDLYVLLFTFHVLHYHPQVTIDGLEGGYDGEEAASLDDYEFYYDRCVPRVAGKDFWGLRKRHYFPMSECLHSDGIPCVTISTEAFLVLCWENCYTKWVYMWECEQKKIKPDPKAEQMETPFTDAKSGQQPFGGWNKEGRDRFKVLCKRIGAARAASYCKPTESHMCSLLHKKYVKPEEDDEEATRKKSKKRAREEAEKAEADEELMIDDI